MQIVELRAENIKRLSAVTIRPEGPLVEISGRFQAIREMLSKDEADFLAQIGTMRSELDAAIAKMQGAEPVAETPAAPVTAEQTYVGGSDGEA